MVKKQTGRILFLVSLILLLVGCESFGPSLNEKLPINPVAGLKDEEKKEHKDLFADLALGAGTRRQKRPTIEMYPGLGTHLASKPKSGVPVEPMAPGQYTLNFDDADLREVAKVVLSDTLGENYHVSPEVSGRVTLQTTRALTRDELIPTLEILLRMNGAVLIKGKNEFRIEPTEHALTGVHPIKPGRAGQTIPFGYQVRVIPLRFIGVEEMQKVLEPIMPENSVVRVDKTRNIIVIAGTGSELQNILETVELFDVNLLKGMSFLIYPLENVNAKTMIGELNEIFGKGKAEENPLRGMFKVIPIERMNAVMVITPQPEYLEEARTWLERLDRSIADTGGSGGVYVYRVQNAEATDLANLLNSLFSKGGKKSAPRAQVSPGRSAVSIGGASVGIGGTGGVSAARRSSASQLSIGGHQDIRVIPDDKNNSLVIVATAQAYETLMEVISKLDLPPLEVLIDATIVEVKLTDSLKHGIQWFFRHGFGGLELPLLNPLTAETRLSTNSDGTTLDSATSGFSYSVTDSSSAVRAVLTALAEQNDINIVSSPSLMVLNNQEATINVGDQVPIATSTTTNTGGGENPLVTNQIKMVDTGITLKIKPRVNAGGMVILNVEQEANEATTTTTSNINSPTISQRKITSTISVQSGDTIVMGGLIKDTRTETDSGIPLLKDIPYLGALFSTKTKSMSRTELVVLITPRVIQNRNDATLITTEFKRKLTGIYQELGGQKGDGNEDVADILKEFESQKRDGHDNSAEKLKKDGLEHP